MRTFALCLIFGLVTVGLSAQVKIGNNPETISASSLLELESDSRVLVITRMSNVAMLGTTPLRGALVYNNDEECVFYFDGANWQNLCADNNTTNVSLELDGTELVLTDSEGNTVSVTIESAVNQTFSTDPIVNFRESIVITEDGNNFNFEVGEITGDNVVNGSLNGVDIQDDSITNRQLSSNSVGQDELAENSVTDTEIDYSQVTLNDFTNDAGFITGAQQISIDAANDLELRDGIFYDDAPLQTLITDNTVAIAEHIAADNDVDQENELITNIELQGQDLIFTEGGNQTSVSLAGVSSTNTDDQTLAEVLTEGNNAQGSRIVNLGEPIDLDDAVTKDYVDNALASLPAGSDNQNLTGATLNPTTNVLEITIEDGDPTTVNLSSLAGGTADGSETIINSGANITITGVGTVGDPYIINSTGGGGTADGDETIINPGTNITITGNGTIATPYVINGIQSTEVVDGTTITGLGTTGDPFKIEPSAVLGQFLRTNPTTGFVEWDDLPAGTGGAVSSDGTTILGDGVATDLQIADGGVTTAKILDENVTIEKIAAGANGQVLTTDALGDVVWAAPTAGTVQTTAAISGDGTVGNELDLADDAVTTAKILDENVTIEKIAAGANGQVLTTDALGDVVWAAPSAGTVQTTAAILGDGTVGNELDLADDAVTTTKILDANVTDTKIAPGAANQILRTNTAGTLVEWVDLPAGAVDGNLAEEDLVQTTGENRTYDLNGNNLVFEDNSGANPTGRVAIGNLPGGPQDKLDVDGQIRARNGFASTGGSEGNPGYGFYTNDDTDTGMYRAAADEIGFTVGGNSAMIIDEISVGNTKVIINQELELLGSLTDNSGSQGTANQVLTSDGVGGVSWSSGGNGTSDGNISEVEFNSPNLVFTGTGDGFNGTIDLSALTAVSTEIVDDETLTGVGTALDPFKIKPSQDTDRYLITNDLGEVAWGELPTITNASVNTDNLTITGDGATTPLSISNGGVNNIHLADNSIDTDNIINGTITNADLGSLNATITGQVLKWNQTTGVWEPGADNQGTPAIGEGEIYIGNAANNPIGQTLGGDASLANDGTLTITQNAIASNEILNGSIIAEDLNQMGANDGQILKWNTTLNTWEPAEDENGTPQLPQGEVYVGDATNNPVAQTISGDASLAINGELTINNESIESAMIANGTIALVDLSNMGAADGEILKWNAVTNAWEPRPDNQSNISNLNDGQIFIGDAANSPIGRTLNGDATLANDGTLTLTANSVTGNEIANGTIGGEEIANMSASAGQALKWNGTAWAPNDDLNNIYTNGTGIALNANTFSIDVTGATNGQILSVDGSGNTNWIDNPTVQGLPGSVFFADIATGLPNQNNAQFFWDQANSRLGVGTNSPTVKLEVIGDARFQGNVVVTGTVNGTTVPDYVFEKHFDGFSTLKPEYQMPTLEEVENYTKLNKHLPGIPSAQFIKDNGLVVNQALFNHLEKIEELFLHTIAQEKKIDALEAENKNLADKVDTLSKEIEAIKALLLANQK